MTAETKPRVPSAKEFMENRVHNIFLARGTILSPENRSAITDMALKLDEELSKDSHKRPRGFSTQKDLIVNLAIELVANINIEKARRLRPDIPQIEPFHE